MDGLILAPSSHDHSYLLSEQRAGTALVFLDRPAKLLAADSVVSDNYEGAQAAVRHLLSHGHRRIAFLGDLSSITTAAARQAGFARAMKDASVPADGILSRQDLRTVEQAEACTLDVLQLAEPPTALFTARNVITEGAIRPSGREASTERSRWSVWTTFLWPTCSIPR